MSFKRGARPSPRHRLAAAMPHRIIIPHPEQFLWQPAKLDMWLNDTYGDCVSAEEAFAKACNDPEIFIDDSTLLAFCQKNNLLNGANLIDVLDLMMIDGFEQDGKRYDDGSPTSVDWTSRTTLSNAIAQGPVKIAVAANQLENTVQTYGIKKNGWFATGYTEDTNLDHCTSLCGYGPIGWLMEELTGAPATPNVDSEQFAYALFTWGSIGVIDEISMLSITGEAWLRSPTTIVRTV